MGIFRYVLVGVAVVLIVLAVRQYWREPGTPTEADDRAAQLTGELLALQAKVRVLERARPLRAGEHEVQALPGATARTSGVREEPSAADLPLRAQPEDYSNADLSAYVDSAFALEIVDRAWSAKANESISAYVDGVLPEGSAVVRSECRMSICRVETVHMTVAAFRSFMMDAFANPKDTFESGPTLTLLLDSEDGQVTAVSYLARPGHMLPAPPATSVNSVEH